MHRCALVLAALLGPLVVFEAAAAESSPWTAMFKPPARGGSDGDLRQMAATRKSAEAPSRLAEAEAIPPLPERKDPKAAKAAAEPDVWSPQQIAEARAHCAKVLKRIEADYVDEPPLKEGRCGTPAPIRLTSIGKKHPVRFSPPALVNCDMAAALGTWITRDVQRLAKRHLGERIAEVSVMSDYSCRTSFGRKGNRLSEHAFADALDIRGFVTQSGKSAHVLDTWGKTKRDIEAEIAAAQAAAEIVAAAKAAAAKEAAMRAAADRAAQKNLQDDSSETVAEQTPAAVAATKLGTPGAGTASRTRADGVDKITVTLPGAPQRKPLEIAARLGGPQAAGKGDAKVAALAPQSMKVPPPGPRAQFLRAAHAAACRIFGTTLGPEANEAHRNHFHVDMAERKYKKICD